MKMEKGLGETFSSCPVPPRQERYIRFLLRTEFILDGGKNVYLPAE